MTLAIAALAYQIFQWAFLLDLKNKTITGNTDTKYILDLALI